MKFTAEQRDALCVEIFRITGLQVDNADPVIICALMQTHYVRQAGADVVSEIQQSTKVALASLTEAMNANSRDAVKMISQEVTSSIRSNVSAETDRAKGVLAKFAESLRAGLAGSKASALPPAPAGYDMKTVGIVAGAVALSSIVAGMVFSPLSAQEREQLEFGKTVLQAIPAMNVKTKRELADAIASVRK